MSKLEIFDFNEHEVRTTVINNEPWFVLKDVCEVLGLTNNSMVADRLDNDERSKFSLGRQGEANIVNESGLYKVIFQSKKEEAKKFTKWVTSEVLPQIRKTGAYNVPQTYADALRAYANEVELKEKLLLENNEMKPKAIFADAVATSKASILIGELAKLVRQNGNNVGQNRLFKWLRENDYLMKAGSSYNMPTQKSMDLELFEIKETTIVHSDGHTSINKTSKVTGKGQIYFINKLCKKEEVDAV